jgi:hypothetical protein
MSFKCPNCGRELYNRKRETCEFCDSVVPRNLRLTASQIASIVQLKAAEAKQHREFMSHDVPVTDSSDFSV